MHVVGQAFGKLDRRAFFSIASTEFGPVRSVGIFDYVQATILQLGPQVEEARNLVIRDMLSADEVSVIADSVEALEEHALAHVDREPRKVSAWGPEYHVDDELGYHVQGSNREGQTIIIEDFWNADAAFDFLVNHRPTMSYIEGIVNGRPTINNSEIRIRYRGNVSNAHGGGPVTQKYRYSYGDRIDCMMVRMVYFVQDVGDEEGAFCVVPGTHKTNMPPPYGNDPTEEPGMIGLEVKAGDAIVFTENLRHGGLPNRSTQVRKTLHVGYGPHWMLSQNIATMDEPQHITDATLARYDEDQRNLFRAWPARDG